LIEPRRLALEIVAFTLATTTFVLPVAAGDDFRPVSFPSLSLAEPRSFGADFYVDDRDRDPQGIDVFDVGFRFRFQIGERTEVFSDLIVDRVVALPEAPAIPSSPRDLIFVGPARSIPNAFVGEHPYVDKRGDARFDAFIPGTATLGLARTLRSDGLAIGVSAALAIPMARSLHALQSGSGSGSVDAIFTGLASRDLFGGKAHTRIGFTLAGPGSRPDQAFSVTGNTVEVAQTKVGIGHRLDLGFAWTRPLSDSLAAAIEMRARKEFVGKERIDAVTPVDLILGVHRRFGRLTASAALLKHFRALPADERRANPLAGGIDLSNVSIGDRNAFLARNGLGAAAGQLRDGVHTVVVGLSTTSLPDGAVRVDPTYNIRSEHNLGYIFTVSFRP
jgi:hypothetical protein